MGARIFIVLLAAILASTFVWAGGASGQQPRAEERAERAEEKAERLAERAEELAEEAEEGGGEKAEERAQRAEERAEKAEKKAERLAQRAEERAENTERQDGGTGGEKAEGRGSGDITLRIGGDPGTEFSGTCTAGGEEETISGQVPQSFDYTLDDQAKLECEIEKEAGGTVKIVLAGNGVQAVQRIGPQGGTTNLTYGGGISFSSSSSG